MDIQTYESHFRGSTIFRVWIRERVRIKIRVRIRVRVRIKVRIRVRVKIRVRIRVRVRIKIRVRIRVRVRITRAFLECDVAFILLTLHPKGPDAIRQRDAILRFSLTNFDPSLNFLNI